ncbi:MAG TPA: hypothetical protein VMN78_09325 [Longimicrobiales bacterium]|nr:hypothetical protein [Longimicrobiales bacterium]
MTKRDARAAVGTRSGSPAAGAGAESRSVIAGLAAELGYPETTSCPFCGGSETELHSAFGSALSVATYWCLGCRTAYDWIKWG